MPAGTPKLVLLSALDVLPELKAPGTEPAPAVPGESAEMTKVAVPAEPHRAGSHSGRPGQPSRPRGPGHTRPG